MKYIFSFMAVLLFSMSGYGAQIDAQLKLLKNGHIYSEQPLWDCALKISVDLDARALTLTPVNDPETGLQCSDNIAIPPIEINCVEKPFPFCSGNNRTFIIQDDGSLLEAANGDFQNNQNFAWKDTGYSQESASPDFFLGEGASFFPPETTCQVASQEADSDALKACSVAGFTKCVIERRETEPYLEGSYPCIAHSYVRGAR